jgi:hypothetical protein
VAQAVVHLLCKCKALSPIKNETKQAIKEEQRKKETRHKKKP